MVEVGLMHFAFWDGLFSSKFEEWECTGAVSIAPVRDMVDGINGAMLPQWRTIAPPWVRHAVVARPLQRPPPLCTDGVVFWLYQLKLLPSLDQTLGKHLIKPFMLT